MKRRKIVRPPRPVLSRAEGTSPSITVASSAGWRHLPLIVLVALAVLIAALRLHTYNEPFERDITSHAVIAHEMLAGRPLYSDLWDSKPPAIFVTYALADALVGYGPAEVYFIGVAAAVITLLGCYWAGSAYGGVTGGLWAAAFWAIICNDLWLWANQPNIEVPMNACLVWAFALMLTECRRQETGDRRQETGDRRQKTEDGNPKPVLSKAEGFSIRNSQFSILRWLAIGGLFALATLYKTVAITFPVFLGLFYLLASLRDRRKLKLAFLQICIVAAVGVAAWAAVFAYFAATHRFSTFYDTIFKYAGYYAQSRGGNVFTNIIKGFNYTYFAQAMKSTPVLIVFTAAGTIYGLAKGAPPPARGQACPCGSRGRWLLLIGFLIGAYLAVALPGRYYNHYYQLWLVPLVVGAGWAVGISNFKSQISNFSWLVRPVAGVVGLITLLCFVLPEYRFSADEWSAQKQGPQYIIAKRVAKELDALLAPKEKLYVLGIDPGFYFWSGRRPPTGVIWSTDLANNPLAEEHTRRALADLEREKPEVVVIMVFAQVPPNHPLVLWAQKHYIPLPGNPDRGAIGNLPFLRIFIRRDGNLAARLAEPRNKLRG
jgi:4-amino-4-deoxy-L-arabinose transferase-like glycosyltransferase